MKSRLALLSLVLAAACSQTSPTPAVAPRVHTEATASSVEATASAESVRRYDFLMGAGRAGGESVTTSGNVRTVHFEFNDRGRGPKIDSTITTDTRAIPVSITTKGNDYLKAAVDETLANGGWSNGA